jgi:hypothetical protein
MREASTDEETSVVFLNFYDCPACGTTWTDEWDCMCNDRCPTCRCEIQPYHSLEIGPSVPDER